MAKFFKSIFHTTERRKAPHYNEHADADEERSESPHGTKRQLSISRSGRMRQANKKRNSLTLELYGDTIEIDAVEKPQSREYHVNAPSHTAPVELARKSRFGSTEPEDSQPKVGDSTKFSTVDVVTLQTKLSTVAIDSSDRSPEEEIDLAFEILHKS